MRRTLSSDFRAGGEPVSTEPTWEDTLMTHWQTLAAATSALAALALAACGGSTSVSNGPVVPATSAPAAAAAAATTQAGSSAAADPCTLVTKDDADAAFGLSFDAPATTTKRSTVTCTYKLSGGASSLSISVTPGSSTAVLDGVKKAYGGAATDVPGVGDEAIVFSRIYTVVKGSTLLSVGTGDGPGIISDEKLLGLVKLAVSRVK
ncbi:MAG: DUF3558 family protein [Candidatus Dormibacteria bacterium]